MTGLFLLNIFQLYFLEKESVDYAESGEYKRLWEEISAMAEEKGQEAVYAAIREEYEEKRQFEQFYLIYLYGIPNEKDYSTEFLEKAYDRIRREKELNMNVLKQERSLYSRITSELGSIAGYDDYIRDIGDSARRLTTISIFQSKDSFAYRNIRKTPQAYEKMKDITLEAAPSKGIELFSMSVITDIIAVFLIVCCAVCVWVKEKEDGIKSLLFSCCQGRKRIAAVKLLTLAIACLVIEIFLYGGNLIMAVRLYGLGDLSRYLPSVYVFNQTAWRISVLDYLILFLVIKYMVFLWLSFIICVIADFCNSMIYTFGSVIGIGAASVLAYSRISGSSLLSFLKYLSPYGLLRTENLFTTYRNLNLFGYPVELTLCTYLLLITGLLLLPYLLPKIYIRRKKNRKIDTGIVLDKVKGFFTRTVGKNVSLLKHEMYKIFITQKVLFVLLALCVIQVFGYRPKEKIIISADEYYFEQYMSKLSGPLTEEKVTFITEEKKRFDKLMEAYKIIVSEGKSNYALQEELKPEQAFQWVLQRYRYISEHKEAYFIYDTPYKEFTAGYNNQNDAQLALEYILLIIICTAGIFGMDYQLKVEKLCLITLKGRYREVLLKFGICIIIDAILMILVYFPFILQNWKAYGMDMATLSYPVSSLPYLSRSISGLSIGGYLLLTYLSRFLYAAVISFTVCMIAYKVRNTFNTILISTLIFALPTTFLLVNEKFLAIYYLFAPILGNLPWTYPAMKGIPMAIILVFAVTAMLIRMIFSHRIRSR
jgi:ABC-type transport system involved in multi-copper enzyme maturation permease subunit